MRCRDFITLLGGAAAGSLLFTALVLPAIATAQEKVRVPWHAGWVTQFDDTHANGDLDAKLFKPNGAAKSPVVVFMHGCGGLQMERVAHWGTFFAQRGVGLLMVDSDTTRNVKNACSDSGMPLVWIKRRADDAASALAWLTSQPHVNPDRIAIMGQSQGGLAELFALHDKIATASQFVAGVAMYPGCIRALNNKIQLAKPVLVLVGSEDAVAPAADCEALQAIQSDKSKLDIIAYPGAAHEFDNPVKPYLLFGKYKGGEDPASRSKAQTRVAQWIDMTLRR
jgi:dienelactone hydrolase